MDTMVAALGLALAACGTSDADVKLARLKLSSVRVSESLVQNTAQICAFDGGGEAACEDHRRAKDKLEAARKDLDAFCAPRAEVCDRARRLEGLKPM